MPYGKGGSNIKLRKAKTETHYIPLLTDNRIYGRYLCCIPACGVFTLHRKYHLCQDHWREYGGKRADRPDWLHFLILQAEREYYAQDRDDVKLASLDFLIDVGTIDREAMVPYKGISTKDPRKRRRKRGRPKKNDSTNTN